MLVSCTAAVCLVGWLIVSSGSTTVLRAVLEWVTLPPFLAAWLLLKRPGEPFCARFSRRQASSPSRNNTNYVWGRRNEDVKMSFLGFLQFNAPYLPWVMLTFSILIGNAVVMDLIGICVGHGYYFLEFVYPVLADIRGWPVKRVMEPPTVLHMLCGTHRPEQQVHLHQD